MQIACVQTAFYPDNYSKKIVRDGTDEAMCMNENLDVARQSCCNISTSSSGNYMCKFTGERVKYSTNEKRCQMTQEETCDWSSIDTFGDGCEIYDISDWHWTDQSCKQQIKGEILSFKNSVLSDVTDHNLTLS